MSAMEELWKEFVDSREAFNGLTSHTTSKLGATVFSIGSLDLMRVEVHPETVMITAFAHMLSGKDIRAPIAKQAAERVFSAMANVKLDEVEYDLKSLRILGVL